MPLDAQKKTEVIQANRRHDKDSGSSEVQIAVLTERIRHLTEHLKAAPKDYSTRRGLQKMVGQRSALLKYLARTEAQRYQALVARLGIRR
ncbi:MAG: 30S ribosomal protein S15 [Planctomycetes bacterium]|nr:30S ribosomal protein S15 [Planctomycetota bacterium]